MDEVLRQVLENKHGLKIGRRIGRGGFAEVYEAQSTEGVPCAIKVLLDPIDEKNPNVIKELESLNLLKAISGHPNVVTLMDVYLIGGYLVTRWELSREGSLHDLLVRYQSEGKKGIPFNTLTIYIYDAAQGIDFLNGQGIYHRDIKPQNLLLFHGRVKIADLGLVKFAGASTVSHTGSGTMGYLPPEAYESHRLSKTVDLYSLAATYVKLRTGREPFGGNPHEIVSRQLRGEPILEGLRPGEAELVRQALAPKPEDRPQNGAKAWVRALYEAHRKAGSPKKTDGKVESQERGATPPPLSSKRLIVGPQGDVRSLEEALAQCEDGATIIVPAGDHRLDRPLEITKSIRLVGAGMDQTRVLCDAEGFVLRFCGAGTFVADGISFEHTEDKPANVVEINSGKAVITACRFRGGKDKDDSKAFGHGLLISGRAQVRATACEAIQNQRRGIFICDEASASLERNICKNNKGSGIAWAGSSTGVTRDNLCHENGFHGIQVGDVAAPTLESNTCEQNAQCGIIFGENASGTAWNNVCGGNRIHGIVVQGSSSPTLEGNTCEQNAGCGIIFCQNASGTARNNVCRANGIHGIVVQGAAAPTLEGNACEQNAGGGIIFAENASGKARNNVCRGNAAHGIDVQGSSRPTLEGNACEQNARCGIIFGDNASGTARNNACRGNAGNGIAVQGSSWPTLEGNTCEQNARCGIIFWQNASGTARNNVCRANGIHGIVVQGAAAPTLEGNACEQNAGGGIIFWQNASGTARNNVCRGNAGNGIDVQDSSSPTLEGNTCEQNDGCGIIFAENASGKARNNVCRGNAAHGIDVQGSSWPTLEGNTCEQNAGCGIIFWQNASGTARNNVCRGNAGNGIDVQDSSSPTLEGNTCEQNDGCGIIFAENASGTARNNVCRGNKAGEIVVQDSAAQKIQDNKQDQADAGGSDDWWFWLLILAIISYILGAAI